MPHKRRHRNQHCAVRQTLLAVANGQMRRNPCRPRKCERLLGCTVEHLVTYLGCVPNDKRHLDHIIPLSHGGSEHFTNLRLLDQGQHMTRKSGPTAQETAAVALLQLRYGTHFVT